MHNQTNNTSKQEATMISFNVFYGLCMKSVKKYPSFKTQITNHKPHKFTYKSCLYDLYYKIYILKNSNLLKHSHILGISPDKVIKKHILRYVKI